MTRSTTLRRALASLTLCSMLAATAASPSLAADKTPATPETLRPEVAALVVSAQDKLKAMDFDGAVADLDGVLAQDPTAFELGIALAVRGGVLFSVGDVDGAVADWTRALEDGELDAATELHLSNNLDQLERTRLQ